MIKKFLDTLDYKETEFFVSKKGFNKIEVKSKMCINAFCYGSKLTYPVYISNQKVENSMDLFIIWDKIKSHCVCIKEFNKNLCFVKRKTKTKNTLVNIVYRVLAVEEFS